MRSVAVWIVCVLAAAACGGSRTDGGQTGSVGPTADECNAPVDCAEEVDSELARFAPTTNPYRFDGAECTSVGVVGGPSGATCVCSIAGSDGSLDVGPVGLDCYRFGRGGDCLWPGDEFDGCDLNDASSCDATCQELERRLDEDAARSFEATSVHVECKDHECKTVVEVEGRCFAEASYTSGRAYDCSLDGDAILELERAAGLPPEQDERPETRSPYVAGTNGMVQLVASRRFAGRYAYPLGFGAMAQFAHIQGGNTAFGEEVDPLEGLDDCGVFASSGTGAAGNVDFYDAAEVRLLDAGAARPFELAGASNGDFYSYVLDLESVEPRFGESYGVHVSGGSFGAAFDSPAGLHLPAALSIPELEATSHFEQADLELTWTGSGDQPLYIHMLVNPTLTGFFSNYEMICTVKDDGAFTIPAAALAAMPAGFASVTFDRDDRRIIESGEHSLLLYGSVQVTHQLALGPICEEDSAVQQACQAMAEKVVAEFEACDVPAPPLAELCPDFLSNACNTCVEYFECAAGQTACTDQGLTSAVSCSCPAR